MSVFVLYNFKYWLVGWGASCYAGFARESQRFVEELRLREVVLGLFFNLKVIF